MAGIYPEEDYHMNQDRTNEERNAGAAETGAGGADSGTVETGTEQFAGDPVTGAAADHSKASGFEGDEPASDAVRGRKTDGNGEQGTDETDKSGGPWKTAKNAVAAERRKAAEQRQAEIIEREKAKAAEKARADAVIEMLDGVNPYSKKPMKDAEDVAVYMRQREIEKKGGDPVTGYADYLAEEARRAASEEETRAASEKWFSDDLAAFAAAHPDVKPDELLSDPDFGMFAEGKVGGLPLSEIYESYAAMLDRHRTAANEKAEQAAAQKLANAQAAAGSVQGRGNVPTITHEQFRKMGYEERVRLLRENPTLYRQMVSG